MENKKTIILIIILVLLVLGLGGYIAYDKFILNKEKETEYITVINDVSIDVNKLYKVGEILRVAEGDLKVTDCVSDYECPRKSICNTYSFWEGLDTVINEYADSYTLEELLKK